MLEKEVTPALRPGGGHVPGRPLRQGHLPQPDCRRPTSTATVARSAATLQPHRPDRPGEHALRGHAGDPQRQAPVRRTSSGCTASWTRGRRAAAPAARDRQLPQGPLPRRAAARLGHLAAGPLLRLRDPRQPGQLLVRLVRRPDRLHRLDAAVVRRDGRAVRRLVAEPRDTEIHHFIGKDITYFHTLFWPAMLKTAGFSLPTQVHIHGFLDRRRREDVEVASGTFVRAATYLEHLDPAYLRYYYASKLHRRRGRHRPEPRRVRGQGERRPGGQRGQSGRAHGAVRQSSAAWPPSIRTTAGCSPRPPPTARRSPRPTRPATTTGRCGMILAAGDRANQFIERRPPGTCQGPGQGPASCRTCARSA